MASFLDDIKEKKLFINASCGGLHNCGQCKIKVNNCAINPIERSFLTDQELNNNIRLACLHEYNGEEYLIINNQYIILNQIYLNRKLVINELDDVGLIVDIGTTTIVYNWINLSNGKIINSLSKTNPQKAYGGDVITRIKFDNENPNVLHNLIINEIRNAIINNIKISRLVLTGNTTMLNILLGYNVKSLGEYPFNVPFKDLLHINSNFLFNDIYDFDITVFPCISAYVGGDIVSGIIASNMSNSTHNNLLIDLGTNGEMVIGNKDELFVASSAAGPAFEAVGIVCGCPSVEGAIYETKIINNKCHYKTIGNVNPIGICGSGLISLISELKTNKLINDIGRLNDKIYFITDDIYITDKDIQSFILAKAAIAASCRVLLNKVNGIDNIYISGGFGNGLNHNDLLNLNIVPKEFEDKIINIKNSSLSGIYWYILTRNDFELNKIINICKPIELMNDDFNDIYISSMLI